jgi:hypothetical protein
MGHYDDIRSRNKEAAAKEARLTAVCDTIGALYRHLNKDKPTNFLDIDLLFKLRAEAFTKMNQLKATIDKADNAIHDLVIADELDIHFKR